MEIGMKLPPRRIETPSLGNRATYKLAEQTKLYKGNDVVLEVQQDTLNKFEAAIKPRLTPVEKDLEALKQQPAEKIDLKAPENIDACIFYHLKNECLTALQAGTYAEQIRGRTVESNIARVNILTQMGENMQNWVRTVIDESPQLLSIQSPNPILRREFDWPALKRRVTDLLGNTKSMLADGPIPEEWLDKARRYYPTLKLPEALDPDLQIVRFGSGRSDITPLVGAPDDDILPQYIREEPKEVDIGALTGTTYLNSEQSRKLLEKIAEQKKRFGRKD